MCSALHELVADIGTTVNLTLVLATVWAIKNEYFTSSVTIGQYAVSESSHRLQNDLIESVLLRAVGSDKAPKTTYSKFLLYNNSITEDSNHETAEFAHHSFGNKNQALWFLDSLAAFDLLEADLLNEDMHYERNGYFCIIYTTQEDSRMDDVNLIFRRLFNLYVTNVNVFLTRDGEPYVMTYFPFAKDHCYAIYPEVYISFAGIQDNKDYKINKTFFPNKIANMHGCQLVVTTWTTPPYMFAERHDENMDSFKLSGIEGRLLALLAGQMNFSIKITAPFPLVHGFMLENGTATGAIQMLVEGKSNMTIGCFLYEEQLAKVVLASIPYMFSSMVVVLPRGSLLSPFERLTKPFQPTVWDCICTSIFIGLFVVFGIKLTRKQQLHDFVFGADNRTPFAHLLSILFGGLLHGRLPRRNFARFLLGVWLFYTLIMRTAYVAELFRLLQDGRSRIELKTIQEAVRKNYTFYTYENIIPILVETHKVVKMHIIEENISSLHTLIDRLMTEDRDAAFTVLEVSARLYNQLNIRANKRVHILPEILKNAPITLYMRKHSYLEHTLNEVLTLIKSSGFIQKFEALELASNFWKEPRMPKKLSVPILYGLFIVYFALQLFAFAVFVLELLTKKSDIIRRTMNFLNY